MKNNQNGSSMVEMLGVLGIVAMLSVGTLSLFSGIMDKYRISATNNQIQTITKKVQQLYVAQNTFKDLNTKVLLDENIIPSEMIVKNQTGFAKNKLGGKVTVNAAVDNGKDSKSFYIWFAGLSKSACLAIAKLNPDPNGRLNLVEIKVGASNAGQTAFSGAPGIYTAAQVAAGTVNLGNLATYCSHKTNNAIQWEFY